MKLPAWRQWIVIAIFAAVVLATGLFAIRAVRRAVYWRAHKDEVIRPWMTLPYIAHAYHVQPRVLYEALGLSHAPHDRRPLKQIAREQGRSVAEVIVTLQKAIEQARREPPPSPPPLGERGRSP